MLKLVDEIVKISTGETLTRTVVWKMLSIVLEPLPKFAAATPLKARVRTQSYDP